MSTRVLRVQASDIEFDIDGNARAQGETKSSLTDAVAVLKKSGGVVAFPTETVYGLGANALDTASVKAVYAAKNRPADNPLIVHVASVKQLERVILHNNYEIPKIYEGLIQKFWPGPLTILLPVHDDSPISSACTVGQDTFAVRMPEHPVARALIALSDLPLAAPSANASTRPSPTAASHVLKDMDGRIPIILDGGACNVGVESTVVDGLSNPPMLLRPGGVSLEDIKRYGGPGWQDIVVAKASAAEGETVRTPGMKYRHYSPSCPVILFDGCGDGVAKVRQFLNLTHGRPRLPLQASTLLVLKSLPGLESKSISKIGILSTRQFSPSIGEILTQNGFAVVHKSLGTRGSDISHNLFAMLRGLDEEQAVDIILVEGIDERDEGLAVMNRLRKAATVTVR
jgi:L-threonylcarbamoyladenylate synthase